MQGTGSNMASLDAPVFPSSPSSSSSSPAFSSWTASLTSDRGLFSLSSPSSSSSSSSPSPSYPYFSSSSPSRRPLLLALSLLLLLCSSPLAWAEEPGEAAVEEEADPTKAIIDQLTIGMVTEVIDGQTFEIRESGASHGRKKTHVKLGNVKIPTKGAGPSEEQHQARLDTGKEALAKLVNKQMIWWKAGPEEVQPEAPSEEDKEAPFQVIGDAWLMDGRHINSLLAKQGHLDKEASYESELARDILSAEADTQKKEAYKQLEEALKESDKQKRKELEEQLKEEAMKPVPFGATGWIAIGLTGLLVVWMLVKWATSNKKKKAGPSKGTLQKLAAQKNKAS